jgi:hypothetical protein
MQGETDQKPTLLPGQAREDVGFCRLEAEPLRPLTPSLKALNKGCYVSGSEGVQCGQ